MGHEDGGDAMVMSVEHAGLRFHWRLDRRMVEMGGEYYLLLLDMAY